MEVLEKRVRQQWYPYQLYGPWLNVMYTLKYGESPNTNVHKLTCLKTLLLSGF